MRIGALLLAGTIGVAWPAHAQRTDDNATTQADDAFGKSVGNESIGIYNPFDVRGFSPVDAGNVRVEGLYFDRQTDLNSRLIDGSTIRVGLSAQSYPFPAPTGIADYTLRKPGAVPLASVVLNYGPFASKTAEIDLQLPIDGERLGIAGGGSFARSGQAYGGTPHDWAAAATLRWAPSAGIQVMPFWSRARTSDFEAQPLIFSAGPYLPKRIDRGPFFGQPWLDNASTSTNYGIVAKAQAWGFDLGLGIFRSISDADASTADLLFGTDLTGAVADRVAVVERDDRSASTSGEFRAARSFDTGKLRHTVIGSLRARAQDRRYGGAAIVDLGTSMSGARDFRPEPAAPQGPKTRDEVRQETLGLAYQVHWLDVGEFSLGVQKTRYRKQVTDPDPAVRVPTSKDSPWLPSATAAVYLTSRLAAYAGYTRGLEESPVAPTEAVNRNEAPPAIRTEQKDGGLRWSTPIGLTAVLGLFDVAKPFFNTDPSQRFRRLGTIRNRGLEISLAGQPLPGLSIVAGTTLIDAEVSGEEVDRGVIGKRPVASFVRHSIVSVDYRLPDYPALSFDAFVDSTSNRVADTANSFVIPARSVLFLGSRYRFKVDKAAFLIRGQVQNVFAKFGWNNGASGFFVPNGAHRYVLSVAADI